MKGEKTLGALFCMFLVISSMAMAKDKDLQRGLLESMQSVPCGAKERGVTGLGSMVASLGVEHVNSHEQLCAQYLLRTDSMDYHIRPMDLKHPVVLPIGQEAEFKIKKDRMILKVADEHKNRKERNYQVVSMEATNSDSKVGSTSYHPADKPADVRPATASPTAPPSIPSTTGLAQSNSQSMQPPDDHPPQQ